MLFHYLLTGHNLQILNHVAENFPLSVLFIVEFDFHSRPLWIIILVFPSRFLGGCFSEWCAIVGHNLLNRSFGQVFYMEVLEAIDSLHM